LSTVSILTASVPLALVPAFLIVRPWTIITCSLVETSLIFAVINIPVFIIMGLYFQRQWGSLMFIKVFAIISLSTHIVTTTVLLITYAIKFEEKYIFDMKSNGMGGFLCGLVVAYKQVVPEHTINLFKRPFIRVKHLPSIILLVHLIFFLFGLIFTTFFIHVTGIFCASIYLRFYKAGDLGITGDRSETFSFASFFPDLFQ
jgi:membrane associated rhomboid family serine protease